MKNKRDREKDKMQGFFEDLNRLMDDHPIFESRGRWQNLPSMADMLEVADCWEWQGHVDGDGYGRSNGHLVHRMVWELLVGSIPEGMTLDHLCRNTICCNPDHLTVKTIGENVLSGYGLTAKNARKTHCVNGHPLVGINVKQRTNGARRCRTCDSWTGFAPALTVGDGPEDQVNEADAEAMGSDDDKGAWAVTGKLPAAWSAYPDSTETYISEAEDAENRGCVQHEYRNGTEAPLVCMEKHCTNWATVTDGKPGGTSCRLHAPDTIDGEEK